MRDFESSGECRMASRQKLCICNTWIFFPDGRTPHESDSQRRHDCKLWKNGHPIIAGSQSRGSQIKTTLETRMAASARSKVDSGSAIESSPVQHLHETPTSFTPRRLLDDQDRIFNLLAFLLVLASGMLLTSGFLAWAYSRMVTAQ